MRLTFLVRFTLVTFASAVIAAVLLAFTVETLHKRSVERDEMIAAIARVDAKIAVPLQRYAGAGRLDPAIDRGLADAFHDATLDEFVTGVHLYSAGGAAVYPRDAVGDVTAIRQAAGRDDLLTVPHGATMTAYQAYATGDNHRFVVAVDFAVGQMEAAFAHDRLPIVLVTGAVLALIFVALVTLAAGASRELERRRRESKSAFVSTLRALAEAVDLRDPYTAGHSQRVAKYSVILAREMNVSEREVGEIENAALLHDLGKIGVPDRVLFKAAPLDADEKLIIGRHPVIGASLLRDVRELDDVVPCILHHHERIDGRGYPDGLEGDAIPNGARIIAVADAFDAMTTDRPYRRAMGPDSAVAELLRGEGTQFDRRYVLAFAELVRRGEIIPPPRAVGDVTFAQRPVLEALRPSG